MNVSKSFRKPYRFKRKKSIFRIFKNRFFWFGLLILVFIVGVFYLIYFHPLFQIKNIQIIGNEKISTEQLQNLLEEEINRKIIFINSKSIFLVNSKEIKNNILENFVQIANLNLKRKLPDSLILKIEERTAAEIWCFHNQPCFNIDKEGIIFEEILGIPAGSLIIKDFQKNQNPILGEKVIEKDNLVLIKNLESSLKEAGATPTEFIILAEERLNAKTNQNWEVYFDLKGNLDWQLTELKEVLEKEIPLNRRGNLEYIDLRFDKVYYRYK